jgi:hypothetical protein
MTVFDTTPWSGGESRQLGTEDFIPIAMIEDKIVRAGHAYWVQKCAGRRFPTRSEIAPREIKSMLSHVMLLKVLEGGADYEFRIAGEETTRVHRKSFQNMRMSEVEKNFPRFNPSNRIAVDRVQRSGQPLARQFVYALDENTVHFRESVLLPFGTGDQVDHILIVGVSTMGPKLTIADAAIDESNRRGRS